MKLRQQGMEFSVWIVKHAKDEILSKIADPMLNVSSIVTLSELNNHTLNRNC